MIEGIMWVMIMAVWLIQMTSWRVLRSYKDNTFISEKRIFLVTSGTPSPEPVLLCPSDRLCKDPGWSISNTSDDIYKVHPWWQLEHANITDSRQDCNKTKSGVRDQREALLFRKRTWLKEKGGVSVEWVLFKR